MTTNMASRKRSAPAADGARLDDAGDSKRARQGPPLSPPSSAASLAEFSLASVASSARLAAERVVPLDVAARLFDSQATTVFLTPDRASWVLHVPRWFRRLYDHLPAAGGEEKLSYSDWLASAWAAHPPQFDSIKIFGKEAVMHRFQLGCGDADYRFSGRTFRAHPFPQVFDAVVAQMKAIVADEGRSRLNTGLINWYEHGEHYIGPHADDERAIIPQSPILAVSLGATRRFVFTPKAGRASQKSSQQAAGRRAELLLSDGDLIVMGGTTQLTHKHALPKMKTCTSRRISVTMRCFRDDARVES